MSKAIGQKWQCLPLECTCEQITCPSRWWPGMFQVDERLHKSEVGEWLQGTTHFRGASADCLSHCCIHRNPEQCSATHLCEGPKSPCVQVAVWHIKNWQGGWAELWGPSLSVIPCWNMCCPISKTTDQLTKSKWRSQLTLMIWRGNCPWCLGVQFKHSTNGPKQSSQQ